MIPRLTEALELANHLKTFPGRTGMKGKSWKRRHLLEGKGRAGRERKSWKVRE